MLPIIYPKDRVKFDQRYITSMDFVMNNLLNTTLGKVIHPDGYPLTWQKLLVSPFEDLQAFFNDIKKLSKADKMLLTPLTTYQDNQPLIATFLM